MAALPSTAACADADLHDRLFGNRVAEILPGHLYLGEHRAFKMEAVRTHLVEAHGVRRVIRCIPPSHGRADHEYAVGMCEHLGLQLIVIDVEDDEDSSIAAHFGAAHAAIDAAKAAGEAVLVHCQAGVSRSASIVIAYVMKSLGMSLEDAFAYVKARRKIVSPNRAFMEELCELDAALHRRPCPFDVQLHASYCFRFMDATNAEMRAAWAETGGNGAAFVALMKQRAAEASSGDKEVSALPQPSHA
mmetsp:Transcript_32406/g.100233  ORF Transcript_32406/g.100233 Transcript_32406/m.100233 type:complete len:246 (-) Transcript_32406:151-888(-)|eukprot:CAMPEP_0174863108 /NCGR_PEP_ID=MMETSP1114-20130205/55550_1 /TAXON_ID=312471 /ORGANISM="Neobodo designis, Strain CCAP 1951/1" /LENGTH=245 /DNA_ID=CAMNT_0016098169 /DNA_START=43 /DNA_END=780 /DNA_ORIENTATION=+